MKLYSLILNIIIILSFSQKVRAQNNNEEITSIASIFQQELIKSGIDIKGINIGGKTDQPGFHLVLLDKDQGINYKLDNSSVDAFYIKSKNTSVYIGSTTLTGLRNGVYWYLNQLGFRYYFPNSTWHFIPKLSSPYKKFEGTYYPSYSHRRIWYAYGTGSSKADMDFNKWTAANMLGGEEVNAGHSYDAIVNRNKSIFLLHPEYFAQKVEKGKIPPDPKFEVSNESLVQLVIKDALRQIESTIQKKGNPPGMISIDPSDGGGFSTNAASLKIGGPKDQAFYLANRVAKAVREKYPTVKVGMYAYNQHAAPPSFDLEPNLVVLIATAMNQSSYRVDELLEMWKGKGITLGIRDYYGVMAWDWDMPGQPNGSKINYVNKLKDYYKSGFRLFSAETNIGWISRGLGHYISTQLLWDVTKDPNEIKNEFFLYMFGKAATEMTQLFETWNGYGQAIPLDGDLYHWGQIMIKASEKEKDNAVRQRISQVKQYLYYIYLFKTWRKSNTDESLINLLNYAYRIQDEGIVASYPLFRRLANSAVANKENMRFDEKNALWKRRNNPVSENEADKNLVIMLRSLDQEERTILTALPQTFQAKTEKGSSSQLASNPVHLRGGHTIIFNLGANKRNIFYLSSGLIKASQYKTLRLNIYTYNKDLSTGKAKLVLQTTIQPKKPLLPISLNSLSPGLYMAFIDDAKNGFTFKFTGNVSYGIVASDRNKAWTFGRNNLVFEVNDIKEFSIKNEGVITLRSPKGRVIDLQKQKGLISIKVEKGENGVWQIQRQSGVFSFQGISPLVSDSEEFLLRSNE